MKSPKKPKVALIHDYLVQYGGAEKTLEAIIEIFPDAPIYTGIYAPKNMPDKIKRQKIVAPKGKILSKFPKYFTFLMPFVFEGFDLREFDVVISDGTAWPKGVITTPNQLHISYVHTPPRFLYGYSVESKQKRDKWYLKPFIGILDFGLRIWDFQAAQRPDYLLTNSHETKKRIKKFYGRDATVIYPPVELEQTHNTKSKTGESASKSASSKNTSTYYLALGRLSAYKNFDFLVKAFNKIDKRLIIVGTGIEEQRLKAIANDHIEFTGRVSEQKKAELLANCAGLINLVEDEDLGIVPIEAMLQGKPVLAHKSAGHLETVQENVTGMFFDAFDTDKFIETFGKFERKIKKGEFEPETIKKSVQKFSKARFKKEFESYILEKLELDQTTVHIGK